MTPDPDRLQELLDANEIHDVVQRLARGDDFADWVCQVLPHFLATTHFLAAPRIQLDGDVAQVDTYCVAHHVSHPDDQGAQTDMVLGLRYVDRFERRTVDGRTRWLIAK